MCDRSYETIVVTTDAGDLTLRPAISKKGNPYWATMARRASGEPYFNSRGVNVNKNVLSGLPTEVTILGRTLKVRQDPTPKGQARVRASARIQLPGHGKMLFQLRVTELGAGIYNVMACIRTLGPGGPVLSEL